MSKKLVAWTEEELEIMRENPLMPAKQLQELLPNRSVGAIYKLRSRLGMAEAKKITDEQSQYIKDNLNELSIQELADYCGVHRTTVERHMRSLGLFTLRSVDVWTLADYNTGFEDGDFAVEYIYEKRYD